MAAARDVRKNLNMFVDGRGYAGQVEEFNAPKLTLKTEDFRGGGMHGEIELTMGHEKLECDFTLVAYDADILANFGVVEGRQIQFTAREALESHDGTTTAVAHSMRGKIKEIDSGASKPGEKGSMKVSVALTYYRLTHGVRVVNEIDVENMIVIQNGVDTLAAIRNALGI
ncbi:MAG TPA: phage major tail tube protein [Pyrinomonadaceae bacterium]|nr:phage major tail tube protein [Pyrinomonadaceae bacterium]